MTSPTAGDYGSALELHTSTTRTEAVGRAKLEPEATLDPEGQSSSIPRSASTTRRSFVDAFADERQLQRPSERDENFAGSDCERASMEEARSQSSANRRMLRAFMAHSSRSSLPELTAPAAPAAASSAAPPADASPLALESLACRSGCGACCIAPSISPSLPALPLGKPAGVRCPHLTADIRCALFGSPHRPAVCGGIQPARDMCGDSAEEALATLVRWEALTAPRP